MKKLLFVLLVALSILALPVRAEEQKTAPAAEAKQEEEVVNKTYSLRYIAPRLVKESLYIYFYNISYGEGSSMMSVRLPKKNVAVFEEELRKLDVPRKNILLRVFTVIAAKEGKSETIENKDLRNVLAEVSNLLNFKSYLLDGASVISIKEGAWKGDLLLSSASQLELRFHFSRVALTPGSGGKRSVTLELALVQTENFHEKELLRSETEIAENGYLVAGVSRIGNDGKSLVLVINAEIK